MTNNALLNDALVNGSGVYGVNEGLLTGQLPTLNATFVATSYQVGTLLDAQLPPLVVEFLSSNMLDGQLPALQGEFISTDGIVVSFDLLLPELFSDIALVIPDPIQLYGTLPLLQMEFYSNHLFSGVLPSLQGELFALIKGTLSFDLQLPSLRMEFGSKVPTPVLLDGELPPLLSTFTSWQTLIDAELPALEGLFIQAALVTTDVPDTYVVNTQTGAVTKFLDFGYTKVGMVRGVMYGLKNGKLYRLQGSYDHDLTPILSTTLTHLDDRVYNDIGELTRSDFLRRCYAIYGKIKTESGVSFGIITGEGIQRSYPLIEKFHNGPAEYRQQLHRGYDTQYWGFKVQSHGGAFSAYSLSMVFKLLDRKVRSAGVNPIVYTESLFVLDEAGNFIVTESGDNIITEG